MEQQRTKEWFEKRKGRVTGSAVGAILGVNPWQKPDDVLRRMVREYHGAESEFTGNAATAHGTFHEDGATFDYEVETGNKVIETGFHPFEDWLGASPDGLIDDDGVIEVKCPYGLRNQEKPEFKTAEQQPHYYAQMQIEMFCTDRQWCDFYQWTPNDSKLERVERNEKWLAKNLPKLQEFHKRYLSELDNPAHLEAKEVELDSDTDFELAQQFKQAKQSADEAKKLMDEAKAALVERANGNKAKCFGLSIFPVERKGSVSYAKVVKDHCPDIDLTPYTGKPSTSWTVK